MNENNRHQSVPPLRPSLFSEHNLPVLTPATSDIPNMPLDNNGQPFDFISITTLEATSEPLFLSPWRHFDPHYDIFSGLYYDAPGQYGAIGDPPPLYIRERQGSDRHTANCAFVMDWSDYPEVEEEGELLRSRSSTPDTVISTNSDMTASSTMSEAVADLCNNRFEEDSTNFRLPEPALFLVSLGGAHKRRLYRSEGTNFFQAHSTFEAQYQAPGASAHLQSCRTWNSVPISTENPLTADDSHTADDSSSCDLLWSEGNRPGISDSTIRISVSEQQLVAGSHSSHC